MYSFLFLFHTINGGLMIKKDKLKELKDYFLSEDTNSIKSRVLNKTSLVDLVSDYHDKLDIAFDIDIKTHNVVDQKNTGNCWSYAGLNIMREEVIKNCNLDSFELSGSYISFFDKLERFNSFMDRLIKYKKEGRDIYDRYVVDILKNGFTDGSNYSEFKELIKKYGVVPKSVYSNSYTSTDTSELNDILSRLLRLFYLDIDKEKYLKYVYKILGIVYGLPQDKFNFEYIDKKGKYHIDKNISPKEFYKKYINIDLDNYIEIYSYKDNKYSYNKTYKLEEGNNISGEKEVFFLNLEYKRLEVLK